MSSLPQTLAHLPRAAAVSEDYRRLVESITDYALFMLDEHGNVTTWNGGAELISGYAADEILGQQFSTLYPADDSQSGKPARELELAREFGRTEDEGWRRRKDGSSFWANVIITAVRGDAGEVRGFGTVIRDLSAQRLAAEQPRDGAGAADRRRAAAELRFSEERFRLLIENIGDYAIYLLDAEGCVSTWNVGAERMKGYSAREIIGQHLAVFFPAEDVAVGKPARELEAARTNGRFEDEGWRVRKDGSRFWANAVVTALRDEAGTFLGFAKITRDLTARRETEEKERELVREQVARATAEAARRRISESEERSRAMSGRLKVVFEGVADAIMAQDREGNIVFANAAAAEVFGFASAEELMGAPNGVASARFDALDHDGGASAAKRLRAVDLLNHGESANTILHLRQRQTGVERWVSTRNSVVSGGGGEPELVITIWHDVTAARRQERHARFVADATAALGRSFDEEEVLTALAESLVPALGEWCSVTLLEDDEPRTIALVHEDQARANAVAEFQRKLIERGLPLRLPQVFAKGETELFEVDQALIETLSDDPFERERLRAVAPRSGLLVAIKVRRKVLGVVGFFMESPLRRHDWSDVVVVEEICRRVAAALENARLYAEAQRAVRRAEAESRAKDEFLATVSHEVRTPLSAILGWARLLKDRVKDEALVKPIEVIHRNALAQAKIIDDILDVSRVITGKLLLEVKPIDLVPVIREAVEVVRASATAKRIELQFLPEGAYYLLVADAERLQQVAWNLLSNAIKFTPAGGVVSARLRQEDSAIALSIEDNGAGIEESFLPFVFDRFRQADGTTTRRVGGLGLGLAIVRHIVELHGGRVSAASGGVGKGSTFTITLPIRAVSHPPAEQLAAPGPASIPPVLELLTSLKVLVVDDDEDARDIISASLTQGGAVVQTAASAAAGFAAFRQFQHAVIVSDIGMPGEDGYALIARIRALSANDGGNVPALALTAFARPEDRARALAAGYTTHAAKPVEPGVLVETVARIVGRTSVL